MSNVRGTIFDNLETGLKTILKANGYDINIKTVKQIKLADTASRIEGTPVIYINDKGDTSLIRFESFNIALIDIELDLHGDNINEMITAVRKYVNSASLGNNVRYVHDTDIEPPEKGEGKANFTMGLLISYWYDRSDP